MATDADLRHFVISDAVVAAITMDYYCNTVPEAAALPFIWARRSRIIKEEVIGQGARIESEWFDVECVSDDLAEALALSNAVSDRLEGHSGLMNEGSYAWVSVQDQFDEYVPRNLDADEQLHVVSLLVEVTHQ